MGVEKLKLSFSTPMSFLDMLLEAAPLFQPFIRTAGQKCAETLEYLHHYDQQYYRQNYHGVIIAVVAYHYGYIAESAAAYRAAHCGVTENGRYGDSGI